MKAFSIWAHKKGDGLLRRQVYIGETDETENVDYGSNVGFHNANHYVRNKIEFVDAFDFANNQKEKIIEGRTNLLSHLTKIIERERDGLLDEFDQLIIEIRSEDKNG